MKRTPTNFPQTNKIRPKIRPKRVIVEPWARWQNSKSAAGATWKGVVGRGGPFRDLGARGSCAGPRDEQMNRWGGCG